MLKHRLDRVQSLADTLIPGVMLVALLVMVLLAVANRSLGLGLRIHWTMELINIAFTWIVFLGAAACFRSGTAITVESFYLMMPPAVRRVVYALVNLVIVATCAVVIYYSYFALLRMWPQSTSMFGISQGWRLLAMPIGMALIGLTALAELIRTCSSNYVEVSADVH